MQVFKFGGASVKDAGGVRNVASILTKYRNDRTVVVVSAMGKTTNKLETLACAYFAGEDTNAIFDEVKLYHAGIMGDLFPAGNPSAYNAVENLFVELQWALEDPPSHSYDHHYDQVVSFGELLSSAIISAYLGSCGIVNEWADARGLIQTDNTYREGKVDYDLSASMVAERLVPLLSAGKMVVTQGFIGGTSENFATTLGREGSDYSAALFAYFLDASRVVIWKDVPGVLNADPKFFRNTKKIDELNYHDAIELTYYGASVIHPKTIKPLQNKNIPLYVRSFLHPGDEGTVIRDSEARINVTSFIFKDNQALISIQPRDFSFIGEDNLSFIFSVFSKHHLHIHVMQNSAISFSACTDHDEHRISALVNELQLHFRVLYNSGVQLMTIRNYDQEIIAKLTGEMTVLLEQRSRHTCQLVLKPTDGAGAG